MFSIPDESFRRFENCTVKLSAKETNWTSFEVRTHPTLLENLISKYDIGPVKLPGLSRNGPQVRFSNVIHRFSTKAGKHQRSKQTGYATCKYTKYGMMLLDST